MIFYILILLSFVFIVVVPFMLFKVKYLDGFGTIICSFVSVMISSFFVIPISVSWNKHADDLGTIQAQKQVVEVYQNEVNTLNKRLADFQYPKGALMNADTPVASIVESISVWQNKLAEARVLEAKAIRSIERRMHSPMRGVITLVGDYK